MTVSEVSLRPGFSKLLILLIGIGLTACSGTPSPEQDNNTEKGATPSDVQPGQELPDVMGLVLDPVGNPISYAIVGGAEYTTSEGIFSGTLNAYPSGWVSVEALGYLTGYARVNSTFKGVDLYETYLTPLQAGVVFDAPDGRSITFPLSTGYEVRIDLGEDDFTVPPRAVQAAAIDPLDIGPFFNDLDTGLDLQIISAFGLTSYDDDLNLVPLAAEAALPISIVDGGNLTESAILAVYDPENGLWVSQDPKCERTTPEMLTCTLTTLSPLVAIFDISTSVAVHEDPVIASMRPGFLSAIISGFADAFQLDIGKSPALDPASDYKNAKRAYDEWMDEHGDVDPNDPEGRKILDDLIDSARRNATATGGEAGKMGLVNAAAAAWESGDLTTGDELMSEAVEIANKLGRNDLNESDCGEYIRLLKRAEQLQYIGGDLSLAQQLIDKVKEMVVDCDVWRGKITVWMITSSSHPGGLDMQARGGPNWFEYHDIQLWTNVKTYELHGTDKIQLVFPEITYVKEHECRNDIKISGQPQGGQVRLEYTGRFDGYEFQINDPPSASGSVSITQKHHFEGKKDDECQVITDMQFSAPNYSSVIAHGFEYGSPPINLQEILSEGNQGSYGEIDTIRGSQDLNNPDPDTGKYPFIFAHINWSIVHVNPILPIEE